jgi:peptidyl-prolyl cis-trans isomerase C
MTLRAILALSLALLAAPAWAQSAKPSSAAVPDPVVARVNGVDLHRSDVGEVLRGLPPQAKQQPIDKLYPQVLDQLVGTLLVSQAGRKQKLADDPLVKRRTMLIQDQIIADTYVQRLIEKNVTDDKLQARYDKFIKDAPPREEVHARHILVANEADAKAIIEDLKKGADFAKLAQEKTTDPTGKTSGGDLDYFTKEDMVPEFANAAFNLKKGEFTQSPVKTQFGWHVIKVEDRRIAKPPTFEQAKPQLANEMAREVVGEEVKKLRTAAKIEVFNLDGSKLGAAPPPQAAAPVPGASVPGAPTLAPETAPPAPTLSPATKPGQ